MKTLLRPSLVLIALAVLSGSLFFSLPNPASAANTTVPVGNYFFCSSQFQSAPCTTTINVGDAVTWDFGGATVTHTTSSGSGGWDSGNVAPGGTFQHTFTEAGSFAYVCNIHPTLMLGVVVVQAPAATPTSPPSSGTTPPPGTTPVAGATPIATTTGGNTGGLPRAGQGPQSGDDDWWLFAALAFSGVTFAGAGLALARRVR